jgi:hypothetical protein
VNKIELVLTEIKPRRVGTAHHFKAFDTRLVTFQSKWQNSVNHILAKGLRAGEVLYARP